MAIFIVIIMTSSILGFVWTNITTNNYTYKGHKFKLQGNSFILNINDKIVNGERSIYVLETIVNIVKKSDLKLYDRYIETDRQTYRQTYRQTDIQIDK